ncbi:hypothetical protein IFM47457_00653 [Aspergillus lentulus]|nr:hypothetical protein IFM47457_00653 [Aspergillus lentulus]
MCSIRQSLVQATNAISPQFILVKTTSRNGQNQTVSTLGRGEEVDPVAVGHCLLQCCREKLWRNKLGV